MSNSRSAIAVTLALGLCTMAYAEQPSNPDEPELLPTSQELERVQLHIYDLERQLERAKVLSDQLKARHRELDEQRAVRPTDHAKRSETELGLERLEHHLNVEERELELKERQLKIARRARELDQIEKQFREPLEEDEDNIKVLLLKHASAEAMSQLVGRLFRINAVPDPRTNAVIVVGPEKRLTNAERLIQQLDSLPDAEHANDRAKADELPTLLPAE